MTDPVDFTKLVPGFDFLQGLVKNAGAALPSIGHWVAPTLDPEELDKRIQELKTVQFWLEQNARMLAATIQALEVQRMTLSTLKTMNVQMGDLRDSLMIRPTDAAAPAPATPRASRASEPAIKPAGEPPAAPPPATDEAQAPAAAVDPMQWWSALTKQFTELATTAMRDGGTAMAAGTDAIKQAATPPAPAANKASAAATPAPAKRASKPATPAKRAAR